MSSSAGRRMVAYHSFYPFLALGSRRGSQKVMEIRYVYQVLASGTCPTHCTHQNITSIAVVVRVVENRAARNDVNDRRDG